MGHLTQRLATCALILSGICAIPITSAVAQSVDRITVYDDDRDAYYAFKDGQYTRFSNNKVENSSYPKATAPNWGGLNEDYAKNMRELVYDSKRKAYYAFKGDQYVKFAWGASAPQKGYPLKISDMWPALRGGWDNFENLIYVPTTDYYYAFKGDEYIRFRWNKPKDAGYPKKTAQHWKGISGKFADPDEVIFREDINAYYMFKGNDYVRYESDQGVLKGYPLKISDYWPVLKTLKNVQGTKLPFLGVQKSPLEDSRIRRLQFNGYSKAISVSKVGTQQPQMYLNFNPSIGSFGNQSYVQINLTDSRVSASSDGQLQYDRDDLRGWYLEHVDVQVKCLTPGFSLASYGPKTSTESGSITSSSGVNLSTGAAITPQGPEVNASMGVNFGNSYSANIQDFSVRDNTSGDTLKTRYYLTATNAAGTWSVTKGGSVPYSKYTDLLRMDAAGQFAGTPLNDLPELAKSNLPIASVAIFKAPHNFKGVASFEVKMEMKVRKVEKTNYVFSVDTETESKTIWHKNKFAVDFNH